MEVLQLDNYNEAASPITSNTRGKQRRPHTVHPSSSNIIKSAIMSKKGAGFIGNTYKPRLFELHTNGQLTYYEMKSNGQKIKKGDIMITSQTRIEKRYGGKRREAKFIIHCNNRSYYLWCNHISKTPKQIKPKPTIKIKSMSARKPCNAIYTFNKKIINKSTNKHAHSCIASTNDKNKTLYPYPYLSSSNSSIISNTNSNSSNSSNNIMIQTPETESLHTPMTLSKESLEYNLPKDYMSNYIQPRSGKLQALEWCDILLNIIAQKRNDKESILRGIEFDNNMIKNECDTQKNDDTFNFEVVERPRSNSCPLRNNRRDEFVGNETEYDDNTIWTLKESYLWSKGDGYYSDQYTLKYFILKLTGKLDWYSDKNCKDKKGSIDVLNSCINVEKRKGSTKRDCKWILFTRRRNYYFWCKDDKKLSDEWYYLIKLIINNKIKKYNQQIEISVNYRKNSSAHNSLSITNFEEYKCEEQNEILSNDGDDDDSFIPQLFCSDIYGRYTSVLMDGESDSENMARNKDKIKQIHKWLPLSYICYDWELLYSSDIDGYSMITFYEKCSDLGPCILIIKDENGYIFGVFLSDSINKDNKLFFGNGETFVFNISPNIKKYKWSGINRFFIHCKNNGMTFGGGDNGHSALVLTDNFRYGISQESQTFNNEILSKNIDFNPCVVEVWTFKNYW